MMSRSECRTSSGADPGTRKGGASAKREHFGVTPTSGEVRLAHSQPGKVPSLTAETAANSRV